jgi:flagellar biogenesis protein FliO
MEKWISNGKRWKKRIPVPGNYNWFFIYHVIYQMLTILLLILIYRKWIGDKISCYISRKFDPAKLNEIKAKVELQSDKIVIIVMITKLMVI